MVYQGNNTPEYPGGPYKIYIISLQSITNYLYLYDILYKYVCVWGEGNNYIIKKTIRNTVWRLLWGFYI